MIADLHGENVAWPKGIDLVRKIASASFDVVEGAQNVSIRGENRSGMAFSRQRFLPRAQ
jgi:hypothetical protein